jgi:uncharacterized protein YciI
MEAMAELSLMKLERPESAADLRTAVSWLQQAADLGHASAQFALGQCLLAGRGIDKDAQAGSTWIAQAAKQDHPAALREIANYYRTGEGVEVNPVHACELLMRAANLGDTAAGEALRDFEEELIAIALDRNRQMASALFRMYSVGLGVPRDPARMWAWLRWAHDGCEPMADDHVFAARIDEDVAEDFRFYLATMDGVIREEGDVWLASLLFDKGQLGIHHVRPVLEVVAEGGSICLYGRWFPGGWWFMRSLNDETPTLIDEPAIEHLSGLARSWRGALKLLDRYPWFKLTPQYVHPEFAQAVWSAYLRRSKSKGDGHYRYRQEWAAVCGRTEPR